MLPILTPSDFVALTNQTLELTIPVVEIEGEVRNFKVSKQRWVYFDITDEGAKVRCFGTVYILPGPLEDGMRVRIVVTPRLHAQFGFTLNIQSLQLSGEGTIKKAADLLYEKLEKEGLFAEERKRPLPYPPRRIALITSAESAAYKDFIKVLSHRYGGMEIELADVAVQGETAPGKIIRAIEWFNRAATIADVLVIIRGGGSTDDLQAFSNEHVTRAVAASRIPTLVAIGHEIDVSLAELAADMRASTPSNAAELLVPDRRDLLRQVAQSRAQLERTTKGFLKLYEQDIHQRVQALTQHIQQTIKRCELQVAQSVRTLEALSPHATLRRGYAIVRSQGKVITSAHHLTKGKVVHIQMSDGSRDAEVQ